jgi:hypothetical protein
MRRLRTREDKLIASIPRAGQGKPNTHLVYFLFCAQTHSTLPSLEEELNEWKTLKHY